MKLHEISWDFHILFSHVMIISHPGSIMSSIASFSELLEVL